MIHLLFAIGIAGLFTSTVYAVLAARSALRFARRGKKAHPEGFHPPVSLLKPLHGAEPDLEFHLETFFRQNYPRFEILFCARDDHDEGLQIARRVAERHPEIPVKFLSSGTPPYGNAKVWSLERMERAAEHGIFVVSDSDVSVTSEYLREVVAPFADKRVGLVTCLYRGVSGGSHGGTIWSRLEAVGMSVEMSAGVLVAENLEGMRFALGPTMAVRRECLAPFGGFQAVRPYHADDFVLGRLIAANGSSVVLSTHVIEHHVLNTGFLSSMRHQLRWVKSTRFSRPKGHLGTVLTFSMPYALLCFGVALMEHRPLLAVGFLAWGWATRVALAGTMTALVIRRPSLTESALLFPLHDFLGFLHWVGSYFGNSVERRGQEYWLREDGSIRSGSQPVQPEATPALTS